MLATFLIVLVENNLGYSVRWPVIPAWIVLMLKRDCNDRTCADVRATPASIAAQKL